MRTQRGCSLVVAASLFATSACAVGTGPGRATEPVTPRTDAVVVGAFNFSESRVLAEIFRQTLQAAGYEAELLGEVGSREIMEPALEQGEVDLVAEYLGTALTFLDPEAAEAARGVRSSYERLRATFETRGIRVLQPSPAENRNEIVVTRATRDRLNLRDISDLTEEAPELVMGGPPECPARPLCLEGLESLYGLDFKSFVPLDSGGPATVAALRDGEVDVAVLFTTNPAIDINDFVVLQDDKHLQPPENIVPVLRQEVVSLHGSDLVDRIDDVGARLTSRALRRLNRQAEIDHVAPEVVAAEWLTQQGVL